MSLILILQVKEAEASVLSRLGGASKYASQGQRVVAGKQLMQASSDIFPGWQRAEGIDGKSRDFYVRQLRDWKYSIDIQDIRPRGMRMYGELCGWALARAHASSGDRIAIAAYLGTADVFDRAITKFAARDDELICLLCGASVRGPGTPERSPSLDRSWMRSEFAELSRRSDATAKSYRARLVAADAPRHPGQARRLTARGRRKEDRLGP